MNNPFKKALGKISSAIKSLKMSTQMILTVVAIFFIFFLLQVILNNYFFQDYYANKTFDRIEEDLHQYVENMNKEDADHFDEMYKFTTEHNAISITTTKNYAIYSSIVDEYTIEFTDLNSSESYILQVPNADYDYSIGEIMNISGFEVSEGVIVPTSMRNASGTYQYLSGMNCNDTCIQFSQGRVDAVSKPINMNYVFEDSYLLQQELPLLINGSRSLVDHIYVYNNNDAYFYNTTINNQDVVVFIHFLGNFDLIITMIPIENSQNIISLVSTYNNYVYLTAIILIFMWSFRLSKVLSTPIQNIEHVARQIANLNFDIEAHEYNNRENTSLSKSINLIARNLNETLETLHTQNEELTEIYNDQIKQVSLKKQLVSSISHELKTPLMVMQVTIQRILDGIIPEQSHEEELLNVIDEINKSSLMIQDMLQIYRLDDINTTLEISEFSIGIEIINLIKQFEHNLNRHQLKIDLNIDQSIRIEADLKLIRRVLSNFLTNAIKYTPEGEKIYIEISKHNEGVYVEITNFGTTIMEKDLEKIWMPFFRTTDYENNRLPTKGSGIGLYLVSEILKAHNATYGIENIENGVKAFFILKQNF